MAKTVSMKVDAFVLNAEIFKDNYYVTPLNRPDYSALKPGRTTLKHDFIPPVVLETVNSKEKHPRIVDPSGNKTGRLGVYLHWVVPKVFRVGKATVPSEGQSVSSGSAEATKLQVSGVCQPYLLTLTFLGSMRQFQTAG
jgi:hypothetical protein